MWLGGHDVKSWSYQLLLAPMHCKQQKSTETAADALPPDAADGDPRAVTHDIV